MLAIIMMFVLGVCGIISIGCYIMVIIKMFQNDEATLGIICLVTLFCAIGGLITFVMGWVKADKLQTHQIMGIWSGAIVIGMIASFLAQ
ncbi:hypothetical protein M4951_17790 [Blastopirellula sp. J2-11]|uniref:hypothetical protein n=1 Tax=Blastopirellula sp. J2-11 TaxID=2943192 RepID=UPI0021C79007|nr:hypothetical protein [Blastopirellula sp. J2-11]UUO05222.1 hypothetical protein M4951_17790 [Blastopirellula sp. J2-11]